MPNETLTAERVHGSVSTDGLRLGGALWVIAGLICAGLLIFVTIAFGVAFGTTMPPQPSASKPG